MNILAHKISGIYQITNTINGHCYIGSSVNIKKRWRCHVNDLKNQRHQNRHLQSAWFLYGSENFRFHMIEECSTDSLINREQFYLDTLKPEYNIYPNAKSGMGAIVSKETRAKLSLAHKGRTVPQERRIRISNSLMGHTISQESREKISLAKKGKPGVFSGHKHTKEARDKMSDSIREWWAKKKQQKESSSE